MKAKDFTKQTDKELEQMTLSYKKDLDKLSIDYRLNKITNLKQMKNLKKDIARILTIKRQRELSAGEKKNG